MGVSIPCKDIGGGQAHVGEMTLTAALRLAAGDQRFNAPRVDLQRRAIVVRGLHHPARLMVGETRFEHFANRIRSFFDGRLRHWFFGALLDISFTCRPGSLGHGLETTEKF